MGFCFRDLAVSFRLYFAIKWLTAAMEAGLAEATARLISKTTDDAGNPALRSSEQDPRVYRQYRYNEDIQERRAIQDLPECEIRNGLYYNLAAQFSMNKEDLLRQTECLFGFSRVGNQIGDRIGKVLVDLKVADILIKDESGLIRLNNDEGAGR